MAKIAKPKVRIKLKVPPKPQEYSERYTRMMQNQVNNNIALHFLHHRKRHFPTATMETVLLDIACEAKLSFTVYGNWSVEECLRVGKALTGFESEWRKAERKDKIAVWTMIATLAVCVAGLFYFS